MNVKDLNKDQLLQLKQRMIDERNNGNGDGTSYYELADADNIITDEEVFEEYAATSFSEDDFF